MLPVERLWKYACVGSATISQWQDRLFDEYPVFKDYLFPTGKTANTWPCNNERGDCWRIISSLPNESDNSEEPQRYMATCKEFVGGNNSDANTAFYCKSIDVSHEDIALHAFNLKQFFENLCKHLAIEPGLKKMLKNEDNTYCLGYYQDGRKKKEVYLSLSGHALSYSSIISSLRDISDLPVVWFVPTIKCADMSAFVKYEGQETYQLGNISTPILELMRIHSDSNIIPLDEIVEFINAEGEIQAGWKTKYTLSEFLLSKQEDVNREHEKISRNLETEEVRLIYRYGTDSDMNKVIVSVQTMVNKNKSEWLEFRSFRQCNLLQLLLDQGSRNKILMIHEAVEHVWGIDLAKEVEECPDGLSDNIYENKIRPHVKNLQSLLRAIQDKFEKKGLNPEVIPNISTSAGCIGQGLSINAKCIQDNDDYKGMTERTSTENKSDKNADVSDGEESFKPLYSYKHYDGD